MPRAVTELPGPWAQVFFDGTDDEGNHVGGLERRRLIATAPCIGCRLRDTDPDKAVHSTYEVWVNGEREPDDDMGCWCDVLVTAGCTPWRDSPQGTLLREAVCTRCLGSGVLDRVLGTGRQYERTCDGCQGTGWAAGHAPWEQPEQAVLFP